MPSATPARTMFRTAARYLTEPHPFARNPVSMQAHSVPWTVYTKRLGRTGTFVLPMAVLVLGWPAVGYAIFNKVGL